MKKKIVWLVVSCLMVLALLLASCAKAEDAAPVAPAAKKEAPAAPAAKEAAAPAAKEAAAPAAKKEAAPAVKEAPAADPEKPKYGGNLLVGSGYVFVNWDEAFQPPWTLSRNIGLVNEDLLFGDWAQGLAGTGEFDYSAGYYVLIRNTVGLLAESWDIPDDETIIFNLRKGIHFAHDPNNAASRLVGGREMVAADVVYSMKRIYWDEKTTMYTVASVARPLDVYATDDYTVVVKTPKGLHGMTWEYTGYNVRIMAPEVGAKYGDHTKWENSVGTGPFICDDYVPMSAATYVRNPDYWGTDPVGPGKGNQLPYLDQCKYLIVTDASTRAAAIRTGKIDVDCNSYPAEEAQQVMKTTPYIKHLRAMSGYPIIGMRMDKPELPWGLQDDPNALKVRRALNMAMNNDEMLDVLYLGEGTTLSYKLIEHPIYDGMYTPMGELPESSRELFEYHPDKAKELLAEAGYPDGFKALVELRSSPGYRVDQVTMMKAYWAKIGVDLEMKIIDRATYQAYQLKHTHTQMYSYGRSAFNPHVMYSSVAGNMYNMSIVDDPILEDYYVKIGEEYFDRDKRDATMKEMNLYAIGRSHYITPPTNYWYKFWQPWAKNYFGGGSLGSFQSGADFKFTWLDRELKKSMGF